MQNKPKLGRAGVSGAQDGGDERRASAPNKPNFGHGKTKGKWLCGKGVMVNSTSDRPRQNKPNFPKRGTEAVSAVAAVESAHYSNIPSFHHSSAMPIVQNKANFPAAPGGTRLGGRGTRGFCAKQSQFPAGQKKGKWFAGKELWYIVPAIGFGKTKPILRCGPRGGRDGGAIRIADCGLCETNPIWAPGKARWVEARTLPPRGKCAKQTQFPGVTERLAAGKESSLTLPGRLCETKPNLGKMGYLGDGAPGRGQSCDIASMPRFGKQTQFRPWRPALSQSTGRIQDSAHAKRGSRC